MVAAIGGAEENAFLIGWLNSWAAPIRLDPAWNQGDYHGRAEPVRGLTEALKLVTLQANHWAWLDRTAAARAALCDANHFLYLVKANQLFLTGHGGSLEAGLRAIQAPLLLIASAEDLVFPPRRHLRALKDQLAALGKRVTYTEAITTELGHLGCRPHRQGRRRPGEIPRRKPHVKAENQVIPPRSDGIFSPLRLSVSRALWLADLVSAAGTRVQGRARLGIGHDNPPQLAEDTMPTDMPAHAHRDLEKILRGGARAIPGKAPWASGHLPIAGRRTPASPASPRAGWTTTPTRTSTTSSTTRSSTRR